jgi:LuxR family maltose regulon positive regulatory protein
MHIALASRSDPPLPLSRLRARGQLMELRQADLRFTPEEAAAFLNQSTGLGLTAEQVTALEARTEGWIAGLQLAALSMRGRGDLSAFIQAFSGSHRFVIDYLAEEVFSQQSEDLRQFLVESSLLDRFTASLCDAVTGRTDSAMLLRELEDNNLFLIPLDDQRQWYRYHQLFQDYLRAELDEPSKANLHKKASQWFMSQGLSAEAVKHALASGDTDLAVQVISQAAAGAFNQAAFQSLLGWLEALPEEIVRGNTVLATYKGLVLFLLTTYEDALPYAEAAEKSLPSVSPDPTQGIFMSLKAHLALYEGQLEECIQLSRDALEYLDEKNQVMRNLTLNVLGQVLEMKGDVASAADIYRQAFESGWQAGDRLGALVVFTNLVFALNELGRRREALAWCKQVVADIKAQAVPGLPLLDAAYLSWSLLAYEADELDLARQYAQRTLDVLVAANFPQGILWGQYILARIHLAEGDFDGMREITQQGRRLASRMDRKSIQGAWFAALEAQADLDSGELPSALRWTEVAAFTPQDSPPHWVEYPYFTYTRVLLAQGRSGEAQTLLDNMEALAAQGGRQRKLITIYLLQALSLSAQGEKQEAVVRVERALEIAAPQDYRRAFLDEGQKISKLLTKARGIAPTFVDELLLAFRPRVDSASQADGLIDPLTEREQEVLRLVAKGLSNREIAEALFVTLGTVKKHLNNIFSKLNVKNRTQAITRGRELGLLK